MLHGTRWSPTQAPQVEVQHTSINRSQRLTASPGLAQMGWEWGQGGPRPCLGVGIIQSAEADTGLGQMRMDSHAPDLCGVANEDLLLLGSQSPSQGGCPGRAGGAAGAGVGHSSGNP